MKIVDGDSHFISAPPLEYHKKTFYGCIVCWSPLCHRQ
jgi:hypothetical protein